MIAHMVLSIPQMAWDAHWDCCLEERRVVRLTAVPAWGRGRPRALSTEAGGGGWPRMQEI